MKKKFLTMLITGMVIVVLSACGTKKQDADSNIRISESVQESNAASDEKSTESFSEEVSLDVTPEEYVGVWAEEIAGRGVITITQSENGTYDINISWGNSAFEVSEWNMAAKYENGIITYTGCTKTDKTYQDENKFTEETVYTDGSGTFWLEDGMLIWEDDKTEGNDELRFINVG